MEHGTGERDLQERELRRLPGYENSGPVRIGNGAANQLQLDVYGYVIETLYLAHQSGVARCGDTAVLHQRLAGHLAERWQMPTRASGKSEVSAVTSCAPRSWPGPRSTGASAWSRPAPWTPACAL